MSKAVLLGAALAALLCACATPHFENVPIVYQTRDNAGKALTISFPYLVSKDQEVADRINLFMHDDMFHALPARLILAAPAMSGPMLHWGSGGIDAMWLDSMALRNGGRTLSIVIEGRYYCPRDCAIHRDQFDFDANTGRHLVDQELIDKRTEPSLGVVAAQATRERLRAEVARLEQSKDHSPGSVAARQLALYRACLHDYFPHEVISPADWLAQLPGSMLVGEGELAFFRVGCGNGGDKDIDTIGDLRFSLGGPALRPYLTPYGRYLVLGESKPAMPVVNPYGQVVRGTLDGAFPLTLFLGTYHLWDDTPMTQVRYYFGRLDQPVMLTPKRLGDLVELEEYGHDAGTVAPQLRFRIDGKRLRGQWSDTRSTRAFEGRP
ncbi:MAG: hypothetical protein V4582_17715 [Pseudomonadota bacterium]